MAWPRCCGGEDAVTDDAATGDAVRTEPLDTEVFPNEARAALAAEGFDGNMDIVRDGKVHCHVCDDVHDPADVTIEAIRRYEGSTNPDDEESILALTCPCGCRGMATTATGVYGDSAVGDAVRAMQDNRRG